MSDNKILVIRGGAIGDFILTLPVLTALRAQFPQTRLEVLGYPHIAQLAVAGGLSDAARAIDARPLAGFFARNGPLDPALEEYFSASPSSSPTSSIPTEFFRRTSRAARRRNSSSARIARTKPPAFTRRKFF